MKIFKVVKILCEQIEMLAEDSKNCVPGELPQNSHAMAELGRELLMDICFGFVVLCLGAYFVKNFTIFIIKLCR